MKIDHQMMLRRLLHHAAVEVDHPLIVAIHEIDLHAGDAPLLEQREGFVHLARNVGPVRPQPDAHVLRFGVRQDGGHVDVRIGGVRSLPESLGPVPRLAQPASISMYSKPAIRGEIDVVVHGGGIHARFEADAVGVTARPPVPRRLTGLDPRSVGDGRGRIQIGDDVRFHQAPGLRADHEHAPRRMHRRAGADRDPGVVH